MGAVHMAVFQFFSSRITDIHDDNFKVERYTGQRVVAINSDGVAFYLFNGYNDCLTIRALGVELHAGFNFLLRWEHAAGDILCLGFIMDSIGFFRLNGYREAVA